MPQAIRRCRHPRKGLAHVPGVDPGLGDAGGDEGAGRELTGDPFQPLVRISVFQPPAEGLAARHPAFPYRWSRPAALPGHKDIGAVVHGAAATTRGAAELGEGFRHPPAGARRRQLVGLGQVEHDVADRPALAARGSQPVGVVESGKQARQLGLLLSERGDDRLQDAPPPRAV